MKDILIVDAGSSKSDWSLIKETGEIVRFKSQGINPVQQNKELIYNIISHVFNLIDYKSISLEIKYFGAGCIGNKQKKFISDTLNSIWGTKDIKVNSDIMAAGISLFGLGSGIACILGTGSNTSLYNHGELISCIPSLGYILGDEGSGAALGKRLINAVYKKILPQNIIDDFNHQYNLNIEDIIHRVYKENSASAFLASFSTFIHNNLEVSDIKDLVLQEFDLFFQRNVIPYFKGSEYEVGFVGSVAFHYSALLLETASKYNIKITKILKAPINSLENFYSHQ